MPRPLKVLIAEDSASDADLLVRRLRQAGFDPDWRRVDTEAAFLEGLRGGLELVISDSEMPQFSGARALELVRQSGLDVPFIIVSGTIGEERGVAAMQQGAADYLFKDRLARFGPAVDQALTQGRLRRSHAKAEEALREAHAHLNHLLARSPTVLFSLHLSDAEGRLSYVSANLPNLTGYTVEEALGAQWWREHVHAGDQQGAWESLLAAAEQGSSRVEYRLRCKDGRWIWVDDRKQAVPGPGGRSAEIVGGWTDVTARKEAEADYLRAQRLEAIGTLSSGIAHDMNNILAPMLMITALLRDKLADPRDGAMLSMAERSVHRGAEIIKQLLAFSRATTGDWKPLPVGPLLRETARMMRESFPPAIRIREEVPGELWPVLGDPVQLRQVLMNLCLNSRDAMPEGGELLLAACNVELPAAAIPAGADVKPGRFLRLTVADSGRGIPSEFVDRIFEPFFTTKEFGRGAGLGLSTVLGLIRGHGGFVTVESEPGRGSRFHAFLPAAGELAPRPGPPAAASPAPARPGLILLADYETIIREGTRRLLENHAYRVHSAFNGREALNLFLRHRDEVQVLLTNAMMPMMNGAALVRAVRTHKPGLKIIAMAGPNDADLVPELAALGVTEILRKPFRPAELLAALERQGAGRPAAT